MMKGHLMEIGGDTLYNALIRLTYQNNWRNEKDAPRGRENPFMSELKLSPLRKP